jgi:tryptophan synthase beta chain
VILFNFSGHGFLDLGAYDAYLADQLVDYAYPEDKVQEALATLPQVGS